MNNGPPTPGHATPDLAPAVLRRMDHGQWLKWFAEALQASRQGRGVPITPFLAGAMTKLRWAADYIELLKNDRYWLARDNKLLRKQVERLGGTPAPPFRPDAEQQDESSAAPEEKENGN